MARSAGLALYLASRGLAKGKTPRDQGVEREARPPGDLVWFHAGPGTRPHALVELARRHAVARADGAAVVTSDDDTGTALAAPLLTDIAPAENAKDIRRFLDHWRPDAVVLAGDVVQPLALTELQRRGIATYLVDARLPEPVARRLRWAPGAAASLFRDVTRILVPTEGEAQAFRRLRVPAERVEAAGHLEEGTAPLPCNRTDHLALAALLATRPVWLAAPVERDEVEAVLSAHTRASRLAHRLLLILSPADPADGPALRDRLEAAGWTTALRSEGGEPDAEVRIFVADVPGEEGLWYRLAPVTFLGSSLLRGGQGHDPCEPAALGSAILVGPQTGRHRALVQRFLAAGAARTVGSGEALGEAVADLLAPDRSAEMARRAWEITSSGAELTDRILDLLARALDEREPA